MGKRSSAGLCAAWGVSIESKGVECVVAGGRYGGHGGAGGRAGRAGR